MPAAARCAQAVVAALLAAMLLAAAAGPARARRSGPPRTQPVDLVVIHSTGGPTCDADNRAIWVPGGTLADDLATIEAHPKLGVHYMIDRDGTLRASVPEGEVAYHVLTLSQRSIGIELVNDGDGVEPFPPAQLAALEQLLRDLVHRHGITRAGVKRHSDVDHTRLPCDISRRRKVDPGEAFPYQRVLDDVFSGAPAGWVPRPPGIEAAAC